MSEILNKGSDTGFFSNKNSVKGANKSTSKGTSKNKSTSTSLTESSLVNVTRNESSVNGVKVKGDAILQLSFDGGDIKTIDISDKSKESPKLKKEVQKAIGDFSNASQELWPESDFSEAFNSEFFKGSDGYSSEKVTSAMDTMNQFVEKSKQLDLDSLREIYKNTKPRAGDLNELISFLTTEPETKTEAKTEAKAATATTIKAETATEKETAVEITTKAAVGAAAAAKEVTPTQVEADAKTAIKTVAIRTAAITEAVDTTESTLHKEALDRFLTNNEELLATSSKQKDIHSKANRLFYNREEAESSKGEKVFHCSKKYKMLLLEKIMRVSTEDSVTELAKKIYKGLKEHKDDLENLRARVVQLQSGGLGFIKSDAKYLELFSIFLLKSGINLQKEDPLYRRLIYPAVLFNLEGRVSIRDNKGEIKDRILKGLGSIDGETLLSSTRGQLIFEVFNSYIEGVPMPKCQIEKIKKNMPKSLRGDLQTQVEKYFSLIVLNKNFLTFLGQEVKRQSEVKSSTKVFNWRSALRSEIGNGATDKRLKAIISGKNISKNGDIVSLSGIPDSFTSLALKQQIRIISFLKEKKIDISPRELIVQAIAHNDKQLTRYILENYQLALTEKDVQNGRAVQLSLSNYDFLKKLTIEEYKSDTVNANYLLNVSGILFYTIKEHGYNGLKSLKREIKGEVSPQMYEYRNEDDSSLAMVIAEYCSANFKGVWEDELTEETRQSILKQVNNSGWLLAMIVAKHCPKYFKEFWNNLNQESRALAMKQINSEDQSLSMIVAQYNTEYFKDFQEQSQEQGQGQGKEQGSCSVSDLLLIRVVEKYNPEYFKTFLKTKLLELDRQDCVKQVKKDNPSSAVFVAKYYSSKFMEFWRKLPEEERQAFCVMDNAGKPSLAMIVAELSSNDFKEFWEGLSKDSQQKFAKQTTVEGMSLAMYVVRHCRGYFKEFWESLSEKVKQKSAKQITENGVSLAMAVVQTNSKYFETLWNSLSSEARQVSFLQISSFETNLVMHIAQSCPENFKLVWNDGALSDLDRESAVENLGDNSVTLAVRVAKNCSPEDLESIWDLIPEEVRADKDIYQRKICKGSSLLDLINEPSLPKAMAYRIKESYEKAKGTESSIVVC